MTKRVEVDGKNYVFQIWDTAGQEKVSSFGSGVGEITLTEKHSPKLSILRC